nr:immunoglobulin light chain junction region [Macaca mulatta]MPN65343.1 immunoglobulin light chain junction region [Macaca mulatta]MPN65366.1 immunoglobulin light chain junction region [Macaca mulatta]MPN65407.1 immunoglobulin light chain junction region [Macaca mulatta]MPN65513.1 immunoglobulin light chain junction region [Macaca mulatta]
CLLYYTGAYIF